MDYHHAGCRTVIERAAGDEMFGKVVIEVGSLEHAGVLSCKFSVSSENAAYVPENGDLGRFSETFLNEAQVI